MGEAAPLGTGDGDLRSALDIDDDNAGDAALALLASFALDDLRL